MTPMMLASSGYSLQHGSALLMLQTKCSLGTARKAMRQALATLDTPIADRLQNGLTKVACAETGAVYKVRPVSTATDNESAYKDICNPHKLACEGFIELPGPVPAALRHADRPAVSGATRANGKPLSDVLPSIL